MLIKPSKLVILSFITIASISTAGLTGCSTKQPEETVGQYVDGSVITTTVKSKILADKSLSHTTITVKTYKNVLQLSGFVSSYKQKLRAEEIARSVDGVTEVNNVIIVN